MKTPLVDRQTILNVVRSLTAETSGHRPLCPCNLCHRLMTWRHEAERQGIVIVPIKAEAVKR